MDEKGFGRKLFNEFYHHTKNTYESIWAATPSRVKTQFGLERVGFTQEDTVDAWDLEFLLYRKDLAQE